MAALLVVGLLAIDRGGEHGPLYDSSYRASSIGFTVDTGAPFTWAYTRPINGGSSTVLMRQAKLEDSSGIEIVQAFVAPPSWGRGHLVNEPTFKPSPELVPLEGARLRPGETVLLVLELEVAQSGPSTANGVSVSYDADGSAFDVMYPDWIRVCTPVSKNESCDSQDLPVPPPRIEG